MKQCSVSLVIGEMQIKPYEMLVRNTRIVIISNMGKQRALVGMLRHWDSPTLLLGGRTGQSLWKTMCGASEVTHKIATWPRNSCPSNYIQGFRYAHTSGHLSISHNRRKAETTQVSVIPQTDKRKAVSPYSRVSLGHREEWSSSTHYIDDPRKHCAKWNNAETTGQILYGST